MDLTFLRPLVVAALKDDRREWTAQGFGFLRTYFGPDETPKKFRLNLWDSRFGVKNVSTIHDHPWDFKSLIVAGKFFNQRYRMTWVSPPDVFPYPSHSFATIKTGVDSGLEKSDTSNCVLERMALEPYLPGDTYGQIADEIHETIFKNGTVTLNERVGDTEHARVFWPFGTDWVDAKPRPATRAEVTEAVSYSLREWF
jgi:hypothetical protein